MPQVTGFLISYIEMNKNGDEERCGGKDGDLVMRNDGDQVSGYSVSEDGWLDGGWQAPQES